MVSTHNQINLVISDKLCLETDDYMSPKSVVDYDYKSKGTYRNQSYQALIKSIMRILN
jgi:hypothetical protein